MSVFSDYKSYKNFAPQYQEWKNNRDFAEEQRSEYLRRNPSALNPEDIKRSRAILRAIDVMDEYSQKNAENAEVATETVVSNALQLILLIGGGLGWLATKLPFINKKIPKGKNSAMTQIASFIGGAFVSTFAAIPLYAWAAKAEVSASRKGRFEAIKKELNDAKTFAILTPEQEQEVAEILKTLQKEKEKKEPFKSLKESWKTVKNIVSDSNEYLAQRLMFERRLEEDKQYFDKHLTDEEIENAKRDQQLLTSLVEKIDIASQDYAENAELATSALITTVTGFGAIFTALYSKVAQHFKWKKTSAPGILSIIATLGASIYASQIQKQASRVGRFKVKQDLLNNPEKLAYVEASKSNEITDINFKPYKKIGMLKFLKNAWKDNRAYNKWEKNEGKQEKNIAQAMKQIEMSEEQIKDAKRLQHNTFKTFNKVDENSQKYSESIEALGQGLQIPLSLIFSGLGVLFGVKHLTKAMNSSAKKDMVTGITKYIFTILLSTLPSIGINAYITKKQKKASRVADMLAINELSDYKNFADYSRFKDK